MDSRYPSQIETTNFARLCRLILDVCSDVLRDVLRNGLDTHIPPLELHDILKSQKNHLRKKLVNHQLSILYPPGNVFSGDLKELDFSLLYILLRNIQGINISPHTKGWGKEPDAADRSLAANIDRLRVLRNEAYGHIPKASLSNTDFNRIWGIIRRCISEIEQGTLKGDKYVREVNNLRTLTMDPDTEKELIERLKKQRDEFVAAVEELKVRQDAMETEQKAMATNQESMGRDMKEMKVRQDAIETEQKAMATNQESMGRDMKETKVRQDAMATEQKVMATNQESMARNMKETKAGLENKLKTSAVQHESTTKELSVIKGHLARRESLTFDLEDVQMNEKEIEKEILDIEEGARDIDLWITRIALHGDVNILKKIDSYLDDERKLDLLIQLCSKDYCPNGSLECVLYLLSDKIIFDKKELDRVVFEVGRMDLYKLLLRLSPNLHTLCGRYGMNDLHMACLFKNVEMVVELCETNQHMLHETNVMGQTPFQVALATGKREVTNRVERAVRESLCRVDDEHHQCEASDLELVHINCACSQYMSQLVDGRGRRVLHESCRLGQSRVFTDLYERFPRLTTLVDNKRRHCLHYIALYTSNDIMFKDCESHVKEYMELLQKRYDITNILDEDGNSVLDLAKKRWERLGKMNPLYDYLMEVFSTSK